MNIKKYLFIAIGVFLIVVIVMVGISTRFNLSNVTADPYAFIEDFFTRWSPALSAVGTLIVAILALLAISEGRRSHRLAMLDQQYYKIEEWIRDNAEAFSTVKQMITLIERESERKKELESECESLEEKKKTLEINEKLIDITKELITINERSIDYGKKGIEELIRTNTKVARSDMTIRPLINSIGDAELLKIYENYISLIDKNVEAFAKFTSEDSLNIFEEPINEMENAIQNLSWYVYYLRNKMISQ